MDYPCAKFGDFGLSRFGFIVRTDRQTDRHNHRITEADDRYTHATTELFTSCAGITAKVTPN